MFPLTAEEEKIKKEIEQLKQEKKAVVLAHNYQPPQIYQVADIVDDSLALARFSQKQTNVEVIVVCGVKFMAETAKILSPEKTVLLPVKDAGCPLADKISYEQLKQLRNEYPDAWVVSYVNSSAEVKALSNICCTSANAIEIVKNIPASKVIFVPDRNLGWWVQKHVPEKEIILWPGWCDVHNDFSLDDVKEIKQKHPNAVFIAHPECPSQILQLADEVLSTSGMISFIKERDQEEFIIGTESGMIWRLKELFPDKNFYPLKETQICSSMKKIDLETVKQALLFNQWPVELEKTLIEKARIALEEMVKWG